MQRLLSCIPILAWLLLFTCTHNSTGPQPPPRSDPVLYPSAIGNFWKYRYDYRPNWSMKRSDTMEVTNIFAIDTVIDGERLQGAWREYRFYNREINMDYIWDYKWAFGNEEQGSYVLGGLSPNDTVINKTAYVKYPVQVGESWIVPTLSYDLSARRFGYWDSSSFACVAVDCTFITPEDTFTGCIVYHYALEWWGEDRKGYLYYWDAYLPGIGVVASAEYASKHENVNEPDFDRMLRRYFLLDYRVH